MSRAGDMVRAEGRLAKVTLRFHEFARCIWFDGHGRICEKWFLDEALTPLDIAIGPRSLWPEAGQLEAVELAKEEARAAAEVLEKRKARRAEVKAERKRSRKIKRTAA